MAAVRNTMKLVEASIGTISNLYGMRIENIKDIYENSEDSIGMICNGFRFGYMQGMKAAKSEMRYGKRAERKRRKKTI